MSLITHFSNFYEVNNFGYARGTYFLQDAKHNALDLITYNQNDFTDSFLTEVNGFFSAVKVDNNTITIISDKARSCPIFYSFNGDDLIVSDNLNFVVSKFPNIKKLPVQQAEFLLSGFVSEQYTIYDQIYQTQMGEIVTINLETKEINRHTYYEYLTAEYQNKTREEYLKDFDTTIKGIFKRLIDYANGRQIVVPLSAGKDSRLVLLSLYNLGYKNLCAYSYGAKGNAESAKSEYIAKTLRIPWFFVEYTNDIWYKNYHSEEFKAFYNTANHMAATPHFQDYIAITTLVKEGKVNKDCIVTPGHAADLQTGGLSLLYPELYEKIKISDKKLINLIYDKHYFYFNRDKFSKRITNSIQQKIENFVTVHNFKESSNGLELYYLKEQNGKYIFNAVRVYDHINIDWWLPLYDTAFNEYWSKVPHELKMNQNLYEEYVNSLHDFDFNKVVSHRTIINQPVRGKLFHMLPRSIAYGIAKIIFSIFPEKIYNRNFMKMFGSFNFETFKELTKLSQSTIGLFTLDNFGIKNVKALNNLVKSINQQAKK